MKKLLIFSIIGILLILMGCSEVADFSTPVEISRKEVFIRYHADNIISKYYSNEILIFYAPQDFAKVGDVVMYTNGVIKVVEK